MMKAIKVKNKCRDCGYEFISYTFPGDVAPYGEFILNSESGGSVYYLNAVNDKPFKEVQNSIDSRNLELLPYQRADLIQNIFNITIDLVNKEKIFLDDLPCPSCKCKNVHWEIISPNEFYDGEIPTITHNHWNSLSQEEKERLIDKKLHKLGY